MARWREQRIFNGKTPYAYYWNKETKQLEINKEEANIYKMIVDLYVNKKCHFKTFVLNSKNKESNLKEQIGVA